MAFLWFVIDLDNVEKDSVKERIIVFDDPMNNNDDTVQYLIIKLIQGILKNCKKDQIFILTHNIHFYLNVRYKWWDRSKREGYDKRTFHLYRIGHKTNVRLIDSAAEDLKTSYDALWHEVRSLYETNQAEYMLNPLRRIFETYSNFNSIRDLFGDDIEAEKLFDVNSHGIDDLEVDLNGKDCKAIIHKVHTIFSEANAEEHFIKHWSQE